MLSPFGCMVRRWSWRQRTRRDCERKYSDRLRLSDRFECLQIVCRHWLGSRGFENWRQPWALLGYRPPRHDIAPKPGVQRTRPKL